MAATSEIFKRDSSVFGNFSNKDWIQYYDSLNAEKSVDECGLELSEDEKECYNNSLKKLKEERAANPGIPIRYEIKYSHWD